MAINSSLLIYYLLNNYGTSVQVDSGEIMPGKKQSFTTFF